MSKKQNYAIPECKEIELCMDSGVLEHTSVFVMMALIDSPATDSRDMIVNSSEDW